MEPDVCGLDAGRSAAQTGAAPWAHEYVQLTKQAHGELAGDNGFTECLAIHAKSAL